MTVTCVSLLQVRQTLEAVHALQLAVAGLRSEMAEIKQQLNAKSSSEPAGVPLALKL